MQRPTNRRASRLALAGVLFLVLLTRTALIAADPASTPTSSSEGSSEPAEATPSPSGTDR